MKNSVSFTVRGSFALFTDPLTRIGGEKCSYHIPTYEALKGIAKSIYWKPTFIWVIDKVRVMKRIQTQTKGVKPIKMHGVYPSLHIPGKKNESLHELSIYTYLRDVEYQVSAHFEWNQHRKDLDTDRIDGKHYECAKRMILKGGRQDVFLGTRECQGYVEPCTFGEGPSELDNAGELALGLMFHGFDYPDESGMDMLRARFWRPTMRNGVIDFPRPEGCPLVHDVRPMLPCPPALNQDKECEE
ncbi:type I-C CRISPR-associated protein Cas5c [Desulfocurvibacter africanus]|uniref:type I-C CRISPR-associated protein Cas5c n=1 Tax=Desulfocurvibacter africanus TaxID=873 RepID=UPI000413A8BE|nr:type I-C CRISPR-associated protein Cas5c [Desulfocurvibacter africanus]